VHNTGFFSITGTGFTQEEVDRQYDIGSAYFNLPLEERADPKYRCDFSKGNYFGYRAVSYAVHLYPMTTNFAMAFNRTFGLLMLSTGVVICIESRADIFHLGQREENNGHRRLRQRRIS
jgi:hypothetical protein